MPDAQYSSTAQRNCYAQSGGQDCVRQVKRQCAGMLASTSRDPLSRTRLQPGEQQTAGEKRLNEPEGCSEAGSSFAAPVAAEQVHDLCGQSMQGTSAMVSELMNRDAQYAPCMLSAPRDFTSPPSSAASANSRFFSLPKRRRGSAYCTTHRAESQTHCSSRIRVSTVS